MAYQAPDILRAAMKASAMSLRQLAKQSQVPQGTLGMAMTGMRPIPLKAVPELVRVLRLKPAAARHLALVVLEDHAGKPFTSLLS